MRVTKLRRLRYGGHVAECGSRMILKIIVRKYRGTAWNGLMYYYYYYYLLTEIGLSPGGCGYFTCIQNIKSVY